MLSILLLFLVVGQEVYSVHAKIARPRRGRRRSRRKKQWRRMFRRARTSVRRARSAPDNKKEKPVRRK